MICLKRLAGPAPGKRPAAYKHYLSQINIMSFDLDPCNNLTYPLRDQILSLAPVFLTGGTAFAGGAKILAQVKKPVHQLFILTS
jgi:hypothetical protein